MTVHTALTWAAGAGVQIGTGEEWAFWILGPLALIGALGMLFSSGAVHSALWLALTMLCLGALYLVQEAPFLGFVQIIVYTGAIMMLFLFVLMLVGKDASDSVVEVLRGQRFWAIVLGVGVACLLVGGVAQGLLQVTPAGLAAQNATGGGQPGNVGNIGKLIFTHFLFPFELTSALLITAAVGAMVFTHAGRRRSVRTQREMVNARFRGEHARPSPLPGPGVFATADSVATPALLPDGSVAPESLSALIDSTDLDQFRAEQDEVAGKAIGPALSDVDAHELAPEGEARR
ncbi:MAG: NADH-quinone oxidoreductase subunit J [Sciscionella sp.]